MEKKILIDGRLLSDHPTGISRYTEQLIKAFRKKYGNEEVSVIVNREYAGAAGCHLIYTKYKPYHPLHFLFFSFFVNRLNYSIYYSPFYSGIWFKKDKRKQVITVHDLMYRRIRNYFSENSLKNGISKFVFNLLVRSTLRVSNLVISVSETTRKDLGELFDRDSVVIGEGVNQLLKKRGGESEKGEDEKGGLHDCTKARLNDACKSGYFLYVGNFRKQKNVDFLVEAYLKSDTPCWLVLAGFPPSHLLPFSPSPLHANKIIFTGALEDQEINYLYKNCVAFVLPSFYEGFGLPVLEAYCAGARVFSSNAGALKEFNHLNIHYFSPDKKDQLISLFERADQLSKPTEGEIKRARAVYCWEKQTDSIIEQVENLMEK